MTLESLKNGGSCGPFKYPHLIEGTFQITNWNLHLNFIEFVFFALPGFSPVFKRDVISVVGVGGRGGWKQLENQMVYLATVLEY